MTPSNMADKRDFDANKSQRAQHREIDRTSLVSNSNPEKLRIHLLNRAKPVIFHGAASLWDCSRWTPEFLASELGDLRTKFRFCTRENSSADGRGFKTAIMETDCEFEEATFQEFFQWLNGCTEKSGLLSRFQRSNYWCYADYKYMAELFKSFPQLRQSVTWDCFGFPQRSGDESTIWIGSSEASTPCHVDTYGCNLVAQIYGRKKWTLFAPDETPNLYPARIPYEESSVFCQVNIDNPDLKRFPAFANAVRYEVILEPGDVLFVPNKWWHYVQSLETSISINTWIELESDHIERVREAIIRTLVCALKKEEGADESTWLNPSEDIPVGTYDQNVEYLHQAVRAVQQREHEKERPSEEIKEPLANLGGAQQRVDSEYKHELCTDDLINCLTNPDVIDLVTEKLLEKFGISPTFSLPLKSLPGDEVCSVNKMTSSTISNEGGDVQDTSDEQDREMHVPRKRKCEGK